jgi:plastocyanin
MSKRVVLALVAAALIAGAFALSCGGKSSSPTTPAGGGGGAAELNSGNIGGSGGVYAHTFNTAGTFNYHCTIHTNMTGTITVVASGGNPPAAAAMSGTTSFTNGTQTINVGSTVTWTNNSGTTHTVTSL